MGAAVLLAPLQSRLSHRGRALPLAAQGGEPLEELDRAPALLISREEGGKRQCEVQLHCPGYRRRGAWSGCPGAQLGKRRAGREADCLTAQQPAELRFDSRPDRLQVVLPISRRTE